MSNEMVLASPTTLMANSQSEVPALQAPLAGWAREKLVTAQADYVEMDQAVAEAKKHKWKTSTLSKARTLAFARVTFYEKVVAALEAGFMLFPPVGNADVIAVRTEFDSGKPDTRTTTTWGRPPTQEHEAEGAPIGEGTYKTPWMGWFMLRKFKDDKGTNKTEWDLCTPLKDAEFPLAMAKPQIIAATNAAMELKIFDEIRLFPFTKKRGDPCILGVVFDPKASKRHYFLISWRIDKADI